MTGADAVHQWSRIARGDTFREGWGSWREWVRHVGQGRQAGMGEDESGWGVMRGDGVTGLGGRRGEEVKRGGDVRSHAPVSAVLRVYSSFCRSSDATLASVRSTPNSQRCASRRAISSSAAASSFASSSALGRCGRRLRRRVRLRVWSACVRRKRLSASAVR